jgi:tetratricopeptide (TPR) repeat protein
MRGLHHVPRLWLLAAVGLGVAGCGRPRPVTLTVEAYVAQGDQAAGRQEWSEAAGAYRRAFAVADPGGSPDPFRADLALRLAQMLRLANRPEGALDWLRRCRDLDPDLYRAWFEEALVTDEGGVLPDPPRARDAYGRYLARAEVEGGSAERDAIAHARARLAALGDG